MMGTEQPAQRPALLDFEKRHRLGLHCCIICFNFLQQLAIISSEEFIPFPEEWLRCFSWLNSIVLVDFLSLFDVSNYLGVVFKVVVTALTPLAIMGNIYFIESEESDGGCPSCRACLITLFATMAVAFLVSGSITTGIETDVAEQQVFIFIGTLCAACSGYALVRALFLWQIKVAYKRMGESDAAFLELQYSEVDVWLFILLSIYPSVFNSMLSLTTLSIATSTTNVTASTLNFTASAATGFSTVQTSGIIVSTLSSFLILPYTYRRADSYQNGDCAHGGFITAPFEDWFWQFQVIILIDKTILLLLRRIDDKVLATSLSLAWVFAFAIFIFAVQPYDRDFTLSSTIHEESGAKWLLPVVVKYVSATNVDLFGRGSNFVLLGFVLLFNLQSGDRAPLSAATIVVSIVAGFVWLYVLFYALGLHRVVQHRIQKWRLKVTWGQINQTMVEDVVRTRTDHFSPLEAEVISDAQCLWIVRYCENVQVRGSALSFARNWSGQELQDNDMERLCEALEYNRTFSRLK